MQEQVSVYKLPKRLRGNYSKDKFQKVQIVTNFYHVEVKPIDQIHIFRLKFIPQIELDDRATRTRLLQESIGQIKTIIYDPVFSGFNIYSTRQPSQKQFTVKTLTHEVSIKQVKVLNIKQNNKILVQFLNNGLRNLMTKLNYIQLGKSGKYFNTKTKQKIQNLIMFSGFKANFMQLEKGIYLRVDTTKKIVRNQTVLQFIDQFYRHNGQKSKDQKRQLLKQQLIKKVIMTNYGRPRYLTISDIQFSDIDSTIIPNQNISIRQYYSKKYGLKIQNPKQPLLVVEEKRKKQQKVLMIPQICLMTGIPDDFDQFKRKKISQATIRQADQRLRQIGKLMEQTKSTSQFNSLRQLGIKISSQMQKIQARIIPPPRIMLGKDERIQSGKQSFFNLFAQPIYASKHSLKLGLIHFSTADVRDLIQIMQTTSTKLKIQLKIEKINITQFDSRRAVTLIDESLCKAQEKYGCNIFLIVIPTQIKSQYKQIKQKCLVKNQAICQIVTQATLRKNGFRSVATKILLQLIAKRGNTLWVPEAAFKAQKVMLAAFDTGKSGKKNVISGVATINSTYSSICSKIEQYTDVNNKMNSMMSIVIKLIDSYTKRNKQPPKQVILFANSCSDDQMSIYNQYFISPLLKKLEQVFSVNRPNITFILVNTKTNQRFFQNGGGNSIRNVPAGTIIAQNVVSNNYDFFMVSQFARKGSAVPNHYKVIYTDSKMEQGILQELIYSQCFNYVNWTGSIKVPGILQYAKKCVKFNTDVLDTQKLCEQLQNKLYFI